MIHSNRHPTYKQLISTELSKIQKNFDVHFIAPGNKKSLLIKLEKKVDDKANILIIMAGCHGEEPAPTLAVFKNHRIISDAAIKHHVNLVLYPLINPFGFDRNRRLNDKGLNCNSNWIHKSGKVAEEIKIISNDLKKIDAHVFASLHEDDETEKEFYLFSFGERKLEKPLLKIGKKYFPILGDGKFDDIEVKDGVVFNRHDGSAEDFMSHNGVKFSCCTETPSAQSLTKRIKCNTEIMLKLIELTAK